jgi:DNA-binding transcriptional LysR family regulator
VAVAEELNFTRAAERLHMAQQALSGSIRRLEQELGVELLVRDTRHVELTAAGKVLLEEGRVLLASSLATWDSVRRVGRGERSVLRIGLRERFPLEYVDRVVADWRTSHPDTDVIRSVCRADDLVAGLRLGEFDVALCFVPFAPGFTATVLGGRAVRLVVDADHPLAARRQVAVGDLAGERLLFWNTQGGREYADYRPLRDWSASVCRRAGFEPRFVLRPAEGGLEAAVAGTRLVCMLSAPPGPALGGRAMVLELRPEPRLPLVALTVRSSPLIDDFLRDAAAVMPPAVEPLDAWDGQSPDAERLAGDRLNF